MREIKFRCWDKERKCWINSVDRIYWDYNSGYLSRPNFAEIMQYTGVKDKNGKEIYEGDWVRKKRGVGYKSKYYPSFADNTEETKDFPVSWNYKLAGWDNLQESQDSNFIIEFEVIGSIHGKPELEME